MSGRPTSYTPELADEICQNLAEGLSLREVCRADGMPSEATVRLWAATDREGFSAQYTRAREAGALKIADELLEIADDGSNDWMERARQDGSVESVLNAEHVQRSRLRVETRKWMLSKMLPKVFGDKVQHTGDGGTGPVAIRVILEDLTTDAESEGPEAASAAGQD